MYRRHVFVTYIGYPFGGGEQFLFDLASVITSKVYWICFYDKNLNPYPNFKISVFNNLYIIYINPADDFCKVLYFWLKLLRPDIVHHQGMMRREIFDVCHSLNIFMLSGYHFWTGLIELCGGSNIAIENNIANHVESNEFKYLKDKLALYVCSDFMHSVVKKSIGYDFKNIIYPTISNHDLSTRPCKKYNILQVNIHHLKGGSVFLECALKSKYKHYFIGIKTEPGCPDLYNKIEQNVKVYNHLPYSQLQQIYKTTKILLIPSIVDETFCKVAYEGLVNGIPIITSGAGNLKILLGDAALYADPNNIDDWVQKIDLLYTNKNEWGKLKKFGFIQAKKFSSEISKQQLINVLKFKNILSNVMLFVPWCDQGLGIQARYYASILFSVANIYIFSYRPYKNCIDARCLQKNHDEWDKYYSEIYYSKNTRENVTDFEIIDFIKRYHISKCILPETCWNRVFDIASLLKNNNVETFAIPNIEIVRQSELLKHMRFDHILCNNQICFDIFNKVVPRNCFLLGYSLPIVNYQKQYLPNRPSIKYLLIGGNNAFSRKNIIKVCQAFEIALKTKPDIALTATIQNYNNEPLEPYIQNPNINIVTSHLSYNDINTLYQEHDMVIHVSKHEGLGIGFYEALSFKTPVITLNHPPHNEIIKHNVNGIIIPSTQIINTENTEAVVMSADFDVNDLANVLATLSLSDIQTLANNIISDHSKFVNRLKKILALENVYL